MMRIVGKSGKTLAIAVYYAAAMILLAFSSSAHHGVAGHGAPSLASPASPSATLCKSADQERDHASAEACCDACLSLAHAGLLPPPAHFSRLQTERKARIDFAQRFGHVSDSEPDNLRSRAPPRLA